MRWVSCETVTHSQGKLSAQASRRSDAQLAPARVFAHDRRGRVRDLRKLRAFAAHGMGHAASRRCYPSLCARFQGAALRRTRGRGSSPPLSSTTALKYEDGRDNALGCVLSVSTHPRRLAQTTSASPTFPRLQIAPASGAFISHSTLQLLRLLSTCATALRRRTSA